MRAGAGSQRIQIIPTLETGDDAAIRMLLRQFQYAMSDPCVVVDREQELGQRVARVRIETCGYEDELRREAIDLGQPVCLDRLPKIGPACARGQGVVASWCSVCTEASSTGSSWLAP